MLEKAKKEDDQKTMLGDGIGHIKSILHYGKDPQTKNVGIVVNQRKMIDEEQRELNKFLANPKLIIERAPEDATQYRLNQLLKSF